MNVSPLSDRSPKGLRPLGVQDVLHASDPVGAEVMGAERCSILLPRGGGGTRLDEVLIPGLSLPCQRAGEEWDPIRFILAQVQVKESCEGQEEVDDDWQCANVARIG